EHGAEPGGEAAATLKIAEQRLPIRLAVADAVEIPVERIGKLARRTRSIERVGRTIQDRPVFADEPLPRALAPRRAQPRQLEIRRVGRPAIRPRSRYSFCAVTFSRAARTMQAAARRLGLVPSSSVCRRRSSP